MDHKPHVHTKSCKHTSFIPSNQLHAMQEKAKEEQNKATAANTFEKNSSIVSNPPSDILTPLLAKENQLKPADPEFSLCKESPASQTIPDDLTSHADNEESVAILDHHEHCCHDHQPKTWHEAWKLNMDALGHGADLSGYLNGIVSMNAPLSPVALLSVNLALFALAGTGTIAEKAICAEHSHDIDPGNSTDWITYGSVWGEFISTWIQSYGVYGLTLLNALDLSGIKADSTEYQVSRWLVFALCFIPAYYSAALHFNVFKDNQENNDKVDYHFHADTSAPDSSVSQWQRANTWTRMATVLTAFNFLSTPLAYGGQTLDGTMQWDSKTALGISWLSAAVFVVPSLIMTALALPVSLTVYLNHQQGHGNHPSAFELKDTTLSHWQAAQLLAAHMQQAVNYASALSLGCDLFIKPLSQPQGLPCLGRNTALLAVGCALSLGVKQLYRNNLKIAAHQPESAERLLDA